jgi:hypothetical protein
MASVKQVDEGARKQEQKRQDAKDMRGMFRDEEESRDREKREQHQTRARSEPSLRFVRWFSHLQSSSRNDCGSRRAR